MPPSLSPSSLCSFPNHPFCTQLRELLKRALFFIVVLWKWRNVRSRTINKCKLSNAEGVVLRVGYTLLLFCLYLISTSWACGVQTHPVITSMHWEQPRSRSEHLQWCSLHGDPHSSSPGSPFPGDILHHSHSGDLVQSQTCGTCYSRSPSSWISFQFQNLSHPNECGLCTEAECDNETFSYSVLLFLRFAGILCACVRWGKETRMKKGGRECSKIDMVHQNEKDPVILFFDQAIGPRKYGQHKLHMPKSTAADVLSSHLILYCQLPPISPILSTCKVM